MKRRMARPAGALLTSWQRGATHGCPVHRNMANRISCTSCVIGDACHHQAACTMASMQTMYWHFQERLLATCCHRGTHRANGCRNRAATKDCPFQNRPTSPLRFTALFVGVVLCPDGISLKRSSEFRTSITNPSGRIQFIPDELLIASSNRPSQKFFGSISK